MARFSNRNELENFQTDQLRHLLKALADNPFYRKKINAAGINASSIDLATFKSRFPFTTKQEIVDDQLKHPPYGSNLTYPLEDYIRFHQTSGSTGKPIRWLDTTESWSWMVDNWVQIFRHAGVTSKDRIFFAFSFGPFLGFWTAFDAGNRLGALCLPGGGLSTGGRLQTILDNQATTICCTPTYAIRMGEVAKNEGVDLSNSNVKTFIVAGEPGGSIPATKAHIQQLWPGSRVVDHHGMTEVGPVSYECPRASGLVRIIEASYIAEIIDPESGEAVPPGVEGELVLTTLGRLGSPLLRYRTGDLVKADPTDNEPDMGLQSGILGRIDDMVVVRGVNVFPSAVEEIIRTFPQVAEFRVEISRERALNELKVFIEPVSDEIDPVELGGHLENAFKSTLALRIPVTIVPLNSLPRFEMKAKRWVKL